MLSNPPNARVVDESTLVLGRPAVVDPVDLRIHAHHDACPYVLEYCVTLPCVPPALPDGVHDVRWLELRALYANWLDSCGTSACMSPALPKGA